MSDTNRQISQIMGNIASLFADSSESALRESQSRELQNRAIEQECRALDDQRKLEDYKLRGIFVLAVYVDGSLWNYFYYPSREKRSQAISNFWAPFFQEQSITWDYEML